MTDLQKAIRYFIYGIVIGAVIVLINIESAQGAPNKKNHITALIGTSRTDVDVRLTKGHVSAQQPSRELDIGVSYLREFDSGYNGSVIFTTRGAAYLGVGLSW